MASDNWRHNGTLPNGETYVANGTANRAITTDFPHRSCPFYLLYFCGARFVENNCCGKPFYINYYQPNTATCARQHARLGIEYTSGANLSFGVELMEFKFNFSLVMSTFSMSISSDNTFGLHINLFAVAVIFILVHYKERAEEETEVLPAEQQENSSDVDLLT